MADSIQDQGMSSAAPGSARWRYAGLGATAWLAVILVCAALLRAWNIARESLWVDEAYTLSVAREPIGAVLRHVDNTPPLHAAFLHYWITFAGTTETALRAPSAIAGVVAVAFVYFLARRFTTTGGALAASAVHAVSFYVVMVGQEGRPYAFLVCLAAAAWLAMFRWVEHRTAGRLVALVVANVALGYVHIFGFFVVFLEFAWVAWATRDDARSRWFGVGAFAVVGIAFLPWASTLLDRTRTIAAEFWLGPSTLSGLASTWVWLSGSVWVGILTALVALVVVRRAWAVRRSRPREAMALAYWLVCLAGPVAVAFVVGLEIHVFRPRYLLFCAVPLAVLVGVVVPWIPAGKARVVAAASFVVVAALPFALFHSDAVPSMHREDWRSAVVDLSERAEPGALVVFNGGVCNDQEPVDRFCTFYYYSERTDLRFFGFYPAKPVNSTNVHELDPWIANETSVWLVQGFFSDKEEIVAARLEMRFAVSSDVQHHGIRIRHYALPAA